MWNKIKYYVGAFFAGVGAILFFWIKTKDDGSVLPPSDPYDGMIDREEEKVEIVDKELNKLREEGTKDLTDDEVIKYWEGE